MLPYLLYLSLFIGGGSIAIDATAGERERQSLEPLLANPLPRWQLAVGKLMASATFSIVAAGLSLVLFVVGFKLLPLERMGMQVGLDATGCLIIFALLIPLGLIAAAAQTTVAAFSKSFREAQSQVSLLAMIPMLPSMALMLNPVKPQMHFYLYPFFGQHFVIERIVRAEGFLWQPALIATLSSFVIAAILMVVASRMYHRESLAVSS